MVIVFGDVGQGRHSFVTLVLRGMEEAVPVVDYVDKASPATVKQMSVKKPFKSVFLLGLSKQSRKTRGQRERDMSS